MDLRRLLNGRPDLLKEGLDFVCEGEFCYQPWILADGIEVGEGQNFVDLYRDASGRYDNNIYLSPPHSHHLLGGPARKLASDPDYFARCNQSYRLCYERIVDIIAEKNDLATSTVFELGCNTGLILFYCALRGAKCFGTDWVDYSRQFDWLNRVLICDVRFRQGVYDNLSHRLDSDPGEFDILVNSAFMLHQSDPLHCLSYLADRARKGLLLWIHLLDRDEAAIHFDPLNDLQDLGRGKPFPLSIHNGVRLTKRMLVDSLRSLGFAQVDFYPSPSPGILDTFSIIYASRTSDVRSALTTAGSYATVAPIDMSGGTPISSGGSADRVFDHNPDTFWVSPERGEAVKGNAWVGFAFDKPTAVRCIRIDQTDNPPYRQNLVRIETSNDGHSWSSISPGPLRLAGRRAWIDVPDSQQPVRMWRIVAAGDDASNSEDAWTPINIAFLRDGDA
jgi:hypothetical protein